MEEKQEFNKPFCWSILSVIFLVLSLGAQIAVLCLQIVNRQLALFLMTNSQYSQGYTDITTPLAVCNPSTSSTMGYYCTKYMNHTVYLGIANVLVIVTILILVIGLGSSIALTVNIRRKAHNCVSQRKAQRTVLGLVSLALVSSVSLMGYYISFYVNFDALTGYSAGVLSYRSSFFIGAIASCGGGLFMLLNYIMLFLVKTEEFIDHKYNAANTTDLPTLMNTLGDMNGQEMMQMIEQNKLMGNENKNAVLDYKDWYKLNKKQLPAKPEIKIQEVEPVVQVKVEEMKEKKLYGGIIRTRPKLPTAIAERKNAYPKLQKPVAAFPKQPPGLKPQVLNILRQVKFDSINKPSQDGEMEVNVSVLPDQNTEEKKEESLDKENTLQGSNMEIALNAKKDKEMEMVSARRNTNGASKKEMSVIDPSRLQIFERKMHVAQHLRQMEQQERL